MHSAAAELARRLARDAEAACRHYLSNGHRQGHYWIVGDVQNNRGRSLYVRLHGPECGPGAAGKWTDGATGEHGDLLDLIQLHCGLPDLRDAMDEAQRFLALPTPDYRSRDLPTVLRGSSEAARRLFAMGLPVAGTPAEAYLRARGITAELGGSPLRYHPACFYRADRDASREARPALLAGVTDRFGAVRGVHRTWLDPFTATKASLPVPRKAMGSLLGNGVRFGTPDAVLAAGEGIETMLSLKSVMRDMPMIAALSAHHLAALILPPCVERLYVACDDDPAGREAMRRLRLREDLAAVRVRDLMPGCGDFNEDLQMLGPAGLLARLRQQLVPEDAARFAAG